MNGKSRRAIAASLLLGAMFAVGMGDASGTGTPTTPGASDYSNRADWLCLPDRSGDACHVDLTTTIIRADGTTSVERFRAAAKPSVDCFYVYPTVSPGPEALSMRFAGPGERYAAKQELARFASVCRTFAPLYRQYTIAAMMARMRGKRLSFGGLSPDTPYRDIESAWRYYLRHWNRRRGVVLIGDSQGAAMLARLIAQEIDGKPAQQLLVDAILTGTNLAVGADGSGGDFAALPLCRSDTQIGCVIAYDSFRADRPPPPTSPLARSQRPGAGLEAACVNPGNLAGGTGDLHAYLDSTLAPGGGTGFESVPKSWVHGHGVETPFVSLPGLLSARCVHSPPFTYLAVRVHVDPSSSRTAQIGGDIVMNGAIQRDFGLHPIDLNLAMGNLISIIRRQAAIWAARTQLARHPAQRLPVRATPRGQSHGTP